MAKTIKDVLEFIKENGIKMVDFKMVDINGQYRHVTIPAENFSEDTMKSGIGFDASNYGYAVVEKSDMVFIPDPDTAVIDPFCEIPTLSMTGNAMIIDNPENRPLAQYPRNIIRAAVDYMKASGIADTMKMRKYPSLSTVFRSLHRRSIHHSGRHRDIFWGQPSKFHRLW